MGFSDSNLHGTPLPKTMQAVLMHLKPHFHLQHVFGNNSTSCGKPDHKS